jgi:prepilin-type N-terminal cleavage/methylation domain-containing protein
MERDGIGMREQEGFTLIELLIVILVIAILASIAVPVFLVQRERGWVSQSHAALKNAATSAESYGAHHDGDYSGLDGADSSMANAEYALLTNEGFKKSSAVDVELVAGAGGSTFCVTATHVDLPAAHDWKVATYNSNGGSPVPDDTDAC